MPISRIPFGEWAPDQGEFAVGEDYHLWKVYGAISYTGQWIAPPAFSGEDLTDGSGNFSKSEVFGLHIHQHITAPSQVFCFVGVNDNILRTTSNDLTTTTATGGVATYSTSPDIYSGWQFTSFGNNIIATQFGGAATPMQIATSPTTNFAKNNTIAGPTSYDPCPRYVSTIKNHLLIANVRMDNTLGPFSSGGLYEDLVMWSATDDPRRFGDPDNTPSATLLGSDYQFVIDEHGPITGLIGGDYAYIFKTRAIYRMDGPPFTFSPVCLGAGTIYPNSIVRYYDDVYFWGPGGPTVIRGGSSVPEVIGLGKIARSITENQNLDFLNYLFEVDVTALLGGGSGTTNPIAIAAVADYRTGIIAWFCGAQTIDLTYRDTPCITYDTNTGQFGAFIVNKTVDFPKSTPRYFNNPSPPSGFSAGDLTQHAVLDGLHCITLPRNSLPASADNARLSVAFGDYGANNPTDDSEDWDEWFPNFITPFRPLYEDKTGPIATRVERIRVPFSLRRLGLGIDNANCKFELDIRIKSKDNFNDLPHDTGTHTYSMDPDGWAYINNCVEAVYHQFDIKIKAYEAGATIQRWMAHTKDLKHFYVEWTAGSEHGSEYIT